VKRSLVGNVGITSLREVSPSIFREEGMVCPYKHAVFIFRVAIFTVEILPYKKGFSQNIGNYVPL
jgi:hypothetical protein